jgi:hypothetical protein
MRASLLTVVIAPILVDRLAPHVTQPLQMLLMLVGVAAHLAYLAPASSALPGGLRAPGAGGMLGLWRVGCGIAGAVCVASSARLPLPLRLTHGVLLTAGRWRLSCGNTMAPWLVVWVCVNCVVAYSTRPVVVIDALLAALLFLCLPAMMDAGMRRMMMKRRMKMMVASHQKGSSSSSSSSSSSAAATIAAPGGTRTGMVGSAGRDTMSEPRAAAHGIRRRAGGSATVAPL